MMFSSNTPTVFGFVIIKPATSSVDRTFQLREVDEPRSLDLMF